jgi:hypothetical protein
MTGKKSIHPRISVPNPSRKDRYIARADLIAKQLEHKGCDKKEVHITIVSYLRLAVKLTYGDEKRQLEKRIAKHSKEITQSGTYLGDQLRQIECKITDQMKDIDRRSKIVTSDRTELLRNSPSV